MTDEVKKAFDTLIHFCSTDTRLKGWDKAYLSQFLKLLKSQFVPGPKNDVDGWLELMAYCEYQVKNASGNHFDKTLIDKINEIRKGNYEILQKN